MRLLHSAECPANIGPAQPPQVCNCRAFERYCEDVARTAFECAREFNPKIGTWEDAGPNARGALIGTARTHIAIGLAIQRLEEK